jgi:acyl carrier protein
MTSLEDRIRKVFDQVWASEKGVAAPPLQDETILLDTGLDSLGFAIFVAMLEEELGYDPFTLSREAYYPETFSDLVIFYGKHWAAP